MAGEEADLRFEVRNSGPAIERPTLEQMFDPASATRAERSCLGLAARPTSGVGISLEADQER
jgi:nitrogen-specific signal transduction histidine kinase